MGWLHKLSVNEVGKSSQLKVALSVEGSGEGGVV